MIHVICDFCGQKMGKEFVHKVEIKPWFDPKTVGHVYRRDFDCCTECAKAIEHRLIMIESNWLWHGKDPNRRYKNWGMPKPTSNGLGPSKNAKEEISMNEDRELKEARDECVRLGLLQKQGKNLNGTDTYVKTEKGERIFKELLEDARNGIVYD